MTKLLEWLTGAGLFAAVWAILLSKDSADSDDCVRHFVMFLPFYAALIFAVSILSFIFILHSFKYLYMLMTFMIHLKVVSVSIIAWRVYTFNTCEEAAKELQQEIKEARADLKKRGLKTE